MSKILARLVVHLLTLSFRSGRFVSSARAIPGPILRAYSCWLSHSSEFQSQRNRRLRDLPQDEVETRRQGEDRQITFSHPENNEPDAYTFAPRPSAFGESRCDPSSTRNRMTHELAEPAVVVAHLQTDRVLCNSFAVHSSQISP
ncbi:hypothetical protein EDC04DRAFT_244320 [Pisolithus marmoratus]|nr:hypothetical protein EDC04DRAFT_244320 [Pisolithus marmoratus]